MSKKKHNQRPKYRAYQQRQAQDAARAAGSKDVEFIWDAVDKMRLDATATSLSALSTNSLLNNHNMLRSMKPEALNAIGTTSAELAKETKRLVGNLSQIGAAHHGRKGRSINEHDHAKALVIFGQYVQWMEDWERSIYPLIEKITDIVAVAHNLEIQVNPDHTKPGQQFVNVVEKEPSEHGMIAPVVHVDEAGYTTVEDESLTASQIDLMNVHQTAE